MPLTVIGVSGKPYVLLLTGSTSPSVCSNGVEGIGNDNGDICCPLTCDQCDEIGCEDAPGGLSECCAEGVHESAIFCDGDGGSEEAPCIIGSAPSK